MEERLWEDAAWDGSGVSPEFVKEIAIRYLDRVHGLVYAVRAAQDRIAECIGQLELLGMDPAKEGSGGVAPSIADGVAKLEELREELATCIAHGSDEIQLAYDRCSGDKVTYALWLHHVQGMTWGKAAKAVDYSANYLRGKGGMKGYQTLYDALLAREVRDLMEVPDAEA